MGFCFCRRLFYTAIAIQTYELRVGMLLAIAERLDVPGNRGTVALLVYDLVEAAHRDMVCYHHRILHRSRNSSIRPKSPPKNNGTKINWCRMIFAIKPKMPVRLLR